MGEPRPHLRQPGGKQGPGWGWGDWVPAPASPDEGSGGEDGPLTPLSGGEDGPLTHLSGGADGPLTSSTRSLSLTFLVSPLHPNHRNCHLMPQISLKSDHASSPPWSPRGPSHHPRPPTLRQSLLSTSITPANCPEGSPRTRVTACPSSADSLPWLSTPSEKI